MPEKKVLPGKLVLMLLVFAPMAFLCSCGPDVHRGGQSGAPEKIIPPAQALDLQSAFVRVAENIKPAVVNISATRVEKGRSPFRLSNPLGEDPFEEFFKYFFPSEPGERRFKSVGTGFIIDQNGYILTNYHVVEDARDIQVSIIDGRDRKTFTGRMVGRDPQTDLAVVKVDGKPLRGYRFPVARLGDSDKIRVGEWAIAIGSPFGLEHTVTVGVISAKRQNVSVEGRNYADLIQTDASINPGNSGGPLVNIYGEVIGINVAIFTPGGGFVGVGFAIPVNKAKEVLSDLIRRGSVSRGWLGIKVQDVTPELAKAMKLPAQEGAIVSDVLQGSPGQESGLKRGDVIKAFGNSPVKGSADLQRLVSKARPGDRATAVILREGREYKIEIKFGRESGEGEQRGFSADEEARIKTLGLTVRNSDGSVAVAKVEQGSLCENAGIQEGDIIREMNKNQVKDITDFRKALKDSGRNILFLIKRGDANVYIAVNME